MTKIKNTRFHLTEDILAGKYPELMEVSEIAASFRRLEAAIRGKQAELLSGGAAQTDDSTAATEQPLEANLSAAAAQTAAVPEIMESLASAQTLWETRAALLAIENNQALLTTTARDMILDGLFEIMFHGSRTVRRTAAQTAGKIIAAACTEGTAVWSDFLRRALFIKKENYTGGLAADPLRITFLSVLDHVDPEHRKSVLNGYASYFKSTRWDEWTCLRLLSGIFTIPVKEWGPMQRGHIGGFMRYFLKKETPEVRVASFYLLKSWIEQGWKPSEDFRGYLARAISDIHELPDISYAENELAGVVSCALGIPWEHLPVHESTDRVLYMENLRSARAWMYKLVNLSMLREKYADADAGDDGFEAYASHLLILLRLNPDEIVFRQAGDDILNIADHMPNALKYEVVRELIQAIETGSDSTGYVPEFMGRFFAQLSSETQTELLADIEEVTSSQDEKAAGGILETVCCCLQGLAGADLEEPETHAIIRRLCGMLNQSLYSDLDDVVSHVQFSAGTELFAHLPAPEVLGESGEYFADLARNLLISMASGLITDILLHPASVQAVSAWMSAYSEAFPDVKRPVAFYSGTFDPFSNGHYAIVREIAEMGFQVYVQVHDLAPNTYVQPLLMRRQIAAMAVTDIVNVQLFPEEITINTEVPRDLVRLNETFPGRKVWLVERSARVENDDIYQTEPAPGSVHGYPHIVFVRGETYGYYDDSEFRKHLTGEVMTLKLPAYYEHMTATEIRRTIQAGKSIEGMVSPQVRNYIRRHNLYGVDNSGKREITEWAVDTVLEDGRCSIRIDGDEAATLSFHTVTDGDVQGVRIDEVSPALTEEITEMLLDEALMALQGREWSYVECSGDVLGGELLSQRGFVEVGADLTDAARAGASAAARGVPSTAVSDGATDSTALQTSGNADGAADSADLHSGDSAASLYRADMAEPVVIFTDALSNIAAPYDTDARTRTVCRANGRAFLAKAAQLFAGTLILNVHTEILNYRLSAMIRDRCAGANARICVPFGKILKSVNIPGVVMIPLESEKRYEPTLGSFRICERKGHPSLPVQMHTIQSMDMPFVLVDDLYHKGYRMQKIGASIETEGMLDDGVIVGVKTSMGQRLSDVNGYRVDSVYNVPNMKLWIIESDMIPFIGSDKVEYTQESSAGPEVLPTIYPMLPYQLPAFLEAAPYEAVYDLSEVCLENAIRLFGTLEAIYKEQHHRSLKYADLAEVLDEPGYPEEALSWKDFQNEPVTEMLQWELTRLKRLKRGHKE